MVMVCRTPQQSQTPADGLGVTALLSAILYLGLATTPVREACAADPVVPFMRTPNASDMRVAFAARGDLWTAPLSGGPATRLTHDSGSVSFPRFSPDGRWIAFTAQRAGTYDVYVMPANGGAERRLTFMTTNPATNSEVVAWTPDSRNVVFLSTIRSTSWRIARAFQVPVGGGWPQLLPLNHSGLLSFGPGGRVIAFNRIFRNAALPKRYLGGQHQNLYTYDFGSKRLDRITDWKGTDTAPMWFGRKIYFLSDRGAGFRANIWAYDTVTKSIRQITNFANYDIDSPSLGGRTITFAQGGLLYALDLPSETLRRINVDVPDDGARTAPRVIPAATAMRVVDAMRQIEYSLSPDGTELAVSAHGDLFALRADRTWRDLTATPGADEDHPSWSPDGGSIAYETDSDGEQQIAIRPSRGGPERLLTHFASGVLYTPRWSPDGSHLLVPSAAHELWLLSTDGKSPRRLAMDPEAEIRDAVSSPDGRWVAYSTQRSNRQRAIHLLALQDGRDTVVSAPMESDRLPCFSADGRVLFFVSQRNEQPMVSDRDEETIIATVDSDGIYAATLDPGDPSPLATHSSLPPPSSFRPDLAGLMARAVALPITPSVIASLEMRGNRLFYETRPLQLIDGDLPGQEGQLHAFDLPGGNERVVARGLDNHSLSARGDSVAVRRDGAWHLLRTGVEPGPEMALDVSSLRLTVDPRLEWAEMVRNAWRLDRDVFFSRMTNGTNWPAVWTAYARLLPHLGSEDDVRYLLGQIQGELASSHTFLVPARPADPRPPVRASFLGVEYALHPASGRYRFAHILAGDNSRDAFRSPLTAPGLGLKEGDLLLAVNGRELRAPDNPDALLLGATGPVTLTVATSDHGVRHTVGVAPIADEEALRRFDRTIRSRALVDRLSNGRVGYLALSDFVGEGWGEFVRQFYPQANKQALIVDVRWNSGGFTSQAVLSVLRRTLAGGFVNRERAVSPLPVAVPPRDMVTLLNWGTGSDGDQFAYYFRTYGLGPLVGTRSWGGVQGINRPWSLMDGTGLLIPKDSLADASGHWIIENTGVASDVEVDDRPDEAVSGGDVQLEAAVRVALDRLKAHPPQAAVAPAELPAYPSAGIVPGASFAGSAR